MTETSDPAPILYCANHPQRETSLRCNRCNKPICTQCAVLTPTGYRCKECVRGQQKIFDTAQWIDYPLAIVLATGLSYVASRIAPVLGFFVIFVAPIAGVIIAEAVRWVVHRRRSKLLFQLTLLGTIAGSLPQLFIRILPLFFTLSGGGTGLSTGLFALLPLLYQALFTFLVASTVYYRMAGINIG